MSKPLYVITECNSDYYINGIKIDDDIFSDEKVEYRIEDREDFIDTLIRWISEATTDKELMKTDLKMLIQLEDRFILSSMSTNDYLYGNSEEFNQRCEEILKAN